MSRTRSQSFHWRSEARLAIRGSVVSLSVAVAEDGDDGGVWRDFVLGAQSARKLQPEEIPTAKPRLKASFCAMRMASPSGMAMTSSRSSSLMISGTNSSEMPWMRWLPTLQPVDSVAIRRARRG